MITDKPIVSTLSRHLDAEYRRGFSEKSLCHKLCFNALFSNEKIISALMRQSCVNAARNVIQILEISPEEKNLVSLKRQMNFIKTLPALPQEKLHKTIALAPKRLENRGVELGAENVVKLLEGE